MTSPAPSAPLSAAECFTALAGTPAPPAAARILVVITEDDRLALYHSEDDPDELFLAEVVGLALRCWMPTITGTAEEPALELIARDLLSALPRMPWDLGTGVVGRWRTAPLSELWPYLFPPPLTRAVVVDLDALREAVSAGLAVSA